MVHLSVAIGRFFEALLYALFGIALWTTLAVVVGAAVLIGAVSLVRRAIGRNRRK